MRIDSIAMRTGRSSQSSASPAVMSARIEDLSTQSLARWENEGGRALQVAQHNVATSETARNQPADVAALDPIITVDGAGTIHSVSDSVERVFGWKATELLGMNVNILMPEPYHSEHDGYLATFHATGRTEHLYRARQFEAVRKDGSFFPIEVSVSRVNVAGQTAPMFVGIIRDLSTATPQEDDAPASLESNTRLLELLAEQTSTLQKAHLRLRIADRMASIGALAAGLGHDMNNVLLPVRAHLNAARTMTMLPPVRHHVEAVQKSVTYLQQLADGLHFLAIDTEQDETEQATTDLHAWWSQAGPLLTQAVPKHVRVIASLPANLPEVGISAHGLTQAVLNLIVNAGQAIPGPPERKRRQGRVRISIENSVEDEHIKLSVADNGEGMSDEVQRNAFEMFYTTKTRGLGTGLGLPLVARVIHRAGGSVQIESERGKGTVVSLLLPVARHVNKQLDARNAVITLADGRAANLIQHLFDVVGVRADRDSDPAGADIWVLEPNKKSASAAAKWRREHPQGRLILFGTPDPQSAATWRSLRVAIIEETSDFEAISSALGRAIADS